MDSLLENLPFEKWVQSLFDHPEASSDDYFWWDENYDPPMWNEHKNPERAVELMTRLFSSPSFLIQEYTPHQINAGLYYMASPGSSCYMHCLIDETVPWQKRQPAIKSIIGLYRDLWAPLYGNNTIANTESAGLPHRPQTACYMWWDIVVIWPQDATSNRTAFIEAIFDVFEVGLNLASEACLESILHGIGHYRELDPARATSLIEILLKRPSLSDVIHTYARQAQSGCIM